MCDSLNFGVKNAGVAKKKPMHCKFMFCHFDGRRIFNQVKDHLNSTHFSSLFMKWSLHY